MTLPEPFHADATNTLYVGDCLDVLAGMDECSVDAVVTDPPYGLGFMGHEWDQQGHSARPGHTYRRRGTAGVDHKTTTERSASMHAGKYDLSASANVGFQAWCQQWAAECVRVLKPGGHLLAFGGSRTYHRLACAVEDAGFEVRDQLQWLYGSGFPKSLDVSKALDAAAGAEREVVGTSNRCIGPSQEGSNGIGTFKEPNWQDSNSVTAPATAEAQRWDGWGTALKPAHEPIVLARKPLAGTVAGNVTQHGTGALNVDGCRIEAHGRPHVEGTGDLEPQHCYGRGIHGSRNVGTTDEGRWPANVVLDPEAAAMLDQQSGHQRDGVAGATDKPGLFDWTAHEQPWGGYGGEGGASRFFYVAKASRAERDAANSHPTVKPVELMRWLVRLVTPPGGVVLDPFAGSGTTGIAATVENKRCVMVERDHDYADIAVRRLSKPLEPTLEFGGAA